VRRKLAGQIAVVVLCVQNIFVRSFTNYHRGLLWFAFLNLDLFKPARCNPVDY
jgi:hypothetical protein